MFHCFCTLWYLLVTKIFCTPLPHFFHLIFLLHSFNHYKVPKRYQRWLSDIKWFTFCNKNNLSHRSLLPLFLIWKLVQYEICSPFLLLPNSPVPHKSPSVIFHFIIKSCCPRSINNFNRQCHNIPNVPPHNLYL